MESLSFTERMWERGQEHLGGLRYGAAVRCLEAAEGAAWRRGDGTELARIYLPLLEARRQIRYQAAEGVIVICPAGMAAREERDQVRGFLEDESVVAGTILLGCGTTRGRGDVLRALQYAGAVNHAARRTGRWLEVLLLIGHGEEVRLAAAGDATFAGGLKVTWTSDAAAMVGDSTDLGLRLPLPGAGRFEGKHPLHAIVRESLIVGWEALALKWQHRHPPVKGGGVWEEMAWLRLALRIDPACEPVAMRLMALGEAAGRGEIRNPKSETRKRGPHFSGG